MTKNEVIEMDKRGRERLRTILKALDGLNVGSALETLEFSQTNIIGGFDVPRVQGGGRRQSYRVSG